MRMISFLSCALAGLFVASHPRVLRADDDDLKDYYEDLKDAREDYYEDLDDYYEDLDDYQRDQARRGYYRYGSGGYAVEPYWSYPQEYYLFGGHPSRYYYTYPDRYYTQRYRYNVAPRYRDYRYQSDPNIWRYDVYGYDRPYRDNRYQRYERRDGDNYRYYDRNDGYRNYDRGRYERRYRR